MSDERRYTEAELRAIIERAAKRQEAARRAEEASEGGLTLEELQQIGAASGIDPGHIASAAKEVSLSATASPDKPDTLAGMPTALRQSRFIPAEVSDEGWARIVSELRDTFDSSGTAGEIGRTREWTSQVRSKNGGAVHFVLEPAAGGTLVTVEQSWRGSAWAFTGLSIGYTFAALVVGLLAVSGAIDGDAGFVPVMFAALALLMFGGSQVGMRLYASRQEKRFERALDRIELIARDDRAGVLSPAQGAPRLDLDALPDEAVAAAPRTRTRS